MSERLQSLLDYCRSNGRVCPLPMRWDELWKMLPGRKRVGGGWQPALPLILAAWWHASNEEKRQRLQEHLGYAEDTGVWDKVDGFLRALPEDQWFHEGE
jgi:hypothetical protein